MKKVLVLVFCLFFFSGCSDDTKDYSVNYMEAKEKIINENAVLLDVRTKDEYDNNHIDGAELLTLDDITEESIGKFVDSKDDVIIVYCQSGNRSNQALNLLNDLGYTEVYDLGSINNWEE